MHDHPTPDTGALCERHGLDAGTARWLEAAARLPHPSGKGAADPLTADPGPLLEPFALDADDRAEVLAAWPDAAWPPGLLYLVERMAARAAADAGTAPEWRDWPALQGAGDVRARCAPIVAFAVSLPWYLRRQRSLGVPDEVTFATLRDVGRQVAANRRMFGGVGLEAAGWVGVQFRSGLYELGRLQYEPNRLANQASVRWFDDDHARALGRADLYPGRPCLRIHIPTGPPLEAEAVRGSLKRARPFFRGVLGEDYPVATCSSWLLDPQLLQELGGGNIARFQELFTLVEAPAPGDADVFRFVHNRPDTDPGRACRATRLHRVTADHVAAGGHWHVRTGWLDLPE
ncbi:acyltransferase domain-containing protein [Nocardiopsis suaedae]|uniref:Acyltransferase domain-containing protein n=1 Tax=Nocardiopsis suaedae TaxID=3018444 RepID=A0ABT4THS3_9ACTN|nr:acyltransferase domain-containing protein [Nocardiopsis suaedae]MDA2803916.1 acyltransferase domain-containing protein [Nocardiopsis suaedae]